jgi:hypothetical protein
MTPTANVVDDRLVRLSASFSPGVRLDSLDELLLLVSA